MGVNHVLGPSPGRRGLGSPTAPYGATMGAGTGEGGVTLEKMCPAAAVPMQYPILLMGTL